MNVLVIYESQDACVSVGHRPRPKMKGIYMSSPAALRMIVAVAWLRWKRTMRAVERRYLPTVLMLLDSLG